MEWQWFQGYLTGRSQRVSMGNVTSEWSVIKQGATQGFILGPLLFTICVNDLPRVVTGSQIKQYADDTTIYHISDSCADLEKGLSKDLASVDKWIQRNGLQINVKKTQMLALSRRWRAEELEGVQVKLRGEEL